MNLPERLKAARQFLGMTQKELATTLKTNPQTWQVYESGKSVPGGNVLESLARLGVNINWLLTGDGEMGQRKWPVRISKKVEGGREIAYDLDEFFGARIYERLRALGRQSTEWLARECKLDQRLIEDFMHRRAIPRVDQVEAIAEVLNVSTSWLTEKSPHSEEHKRHEEMALAIDSVNNTNEDLITIETASKAIEKCISEYDYHLDCEKSITLLMTVFTIFKNDFCDRKSELFDPIVKNLVKLCLPGREVPNVSHVMEHIESARDAVVAGNIDKARIEFMRGAKDWKDVIAARDPSFPDKMEEARQAFTDFVQSDPVYLEGVKTLVAVIKANPGIVQSDLYNSCPGIARKIVIYILNFAILWEIIDRSPDDRLRVIK